MYYPILIIVMTLAGIYCNMYRRSGRLLLDVGDVHSGSVVGGVLAVITGYCLLGGVKRGLYSNEAGVGSAPNASASAKVTHPAKQGLVQVLSVYIDTLLLCTATALMCLSSGAVRSEKTAGAPYVQSAISTVFGSIGPVFITLAMVLFAFTTLIGNLYYVDNAIIYLNHKKKPSKRFTTGFHIVCVLVVFIGAIVPMDIAWAMADITMGGMTFSNCFQHIILPGISSIFFLPFFPNSLNSIATALHSVSISPISKRLHLYSL